MSSSNLSASPNTIRRPAIEQTTPLTQLARRRDPEGKRQRILKAAKQLFHTRGFTRTRTADIARSIGISEGIIYHHFGDKNALLEAVVERYAEGMVTAMFGIQTGCVQSDITQAVRCLFDYAGAHDLFVVRLGEASSMTQSPFEIHRAVVMRGLTAQLHKWQAAGQITLRAPDVTSALMFGLGLTAVTDYYLRGAGRRAALIRETTAGMNGLLVGKAS